MKEILPAIYEWIGAWEKKAAYDGLPGVVNVGCIRGGYPWRVSRTPDRTDVFQFMKAEIDRLTER